MPTYKLTYFNGRARGELARFVFAAAGVKFEDERITFEEWPKHKPKMPMGFMPVLTVDGEQISQSMTIARYLAREFGLAGKTSWDQAGVDQVVDTCIDLFNNEIVPIFKAKDDESKKAELEKKFQEEGLPKYLGILEKVLCSNNGGDGFFVGTALSLADLAVYDVFTDSAFGKCENALDKFPKIKAHRQRVAGLPNIAKWIKERPQSFF